MDTGLKISQVQQKHSESSLGHTLSFCPNFVKFVSEGISHPVFYGDLVYKLSRVKSAADIVSSGWKIGKRIRRQKFDPVIIERTIGLVLGHSTSFYRSFQEHFTLNRWWGLIDWTCQNLPRGDKALVLVPSYCKSGLLQPLDLSSVQDGRSLSNFGGCLYIFDTSILSLSP